MSGKTATEDTRKRTKDEEVTRILASATLKKNCQRISLLLQTLQVVHNNLPFVVGEWEESQLLHAVITKEEFRAVVNRQTITHAVEELYASGVVEMTHVIRVNRIPGVKFFTMVTDFWTCKTLGMKFVGLRLYYIDNDWKFGSILLGTRHFKPLYGERDQGIREPYARWLKQILGDFGLTTADFFGATTDGGPDVKWMMESGLRLQWEWCWPHLTNAATKEAFGMTGDRNPGMRSLLSKVTVTIYQVRSVEVMGSLYAELVDALGVGKEWKLVDYKPHRFMGLTQVFRRIVKHWDVFELWYEERTRKFERDGKISPNPFPLSGQKKLMEQLLSLLVPISAVNVKSQAEKVNQVDVLLSVYKLGMKTLAVDQPLVKFDSTIEHVVHDHPTELLLLAETTRNLRSQPFQTRFFSRYTCREAMKKCSFVWEIQLLLHPHTKNIDGMLVGIVGACGRSQRLSDGVIERNKSAVKQLVLQRLKTIMMSLQPSEAEPVMQVPAAFYPNGGFSEDLCDFLPLTVARAPEQPTLQMLLEGRVDEELDRWFSDPQLLVATSATDVETVLNFWKRMLETGTYRC
ncbi:hypothetical protein PHYSODRAFT_337267 [Phytophthora sojae]|uniref:HAT C-terminal dimerisation domain-containing protein n=1 Tax=Phytophthora sojae (strain P6497) TaxID=1094619 RepID=G5A014_PHYSP|nr:hypothetical protein PHYSODRAFT_337267 [Phytophthora sojae]EGZ10456.1 hypothetical protein PHYSODRAFT_337267 [Phytophthora sojae]|eukprot:XP_009533201.1 hypothetical protein PHYSODRAFT_337267 [Phytophthora sojae]